jgi:5,6-dimethylbenzimidazole synthase
MEPAVLRTILGIPDRIVPVAYLCIGFVESFPERPVFESMGWLPRLPLHEVVFHDRWDKRPRPDLLRALETSRIDGEQATSAPIINSAEDRAE